MSVWDGYESRLKHIGETKRESVYKRAAREFTNKDPDSLSYHTALIDGVEQNFMIVTARNTNQRRIMSMPGEKIKLGGLVEWMGNYWLVTEKDADTTLYEKALMEQCNHILRWITDGGVIHEQWCIISDSTKYMTGEFEDRQFIVTRPDSRIAMTIARNEETVKFSRLSRFLIDDPDSPLKLSYVLSKPVKLGSVIDGEGVFNFVLQEVNSTQDDNHELGIADYYLYFPRDDEDVIIDDEPSDDEQQEEVTPGKKGWL